MEQTERTGNVEAPEFIVRGGQLWVCRAGKDLCLGPIDEAHEAMAEHLAAVDYGEMA